MSNWTENDSDAEIRTDLSEIQHPNHLREAAAHEEADTPGDAEDTGTGDSLSRYFRQIRDQDRLEPGEERILWEEIEKYTAAFRSELYILPFVLSEHLLLLDDCSPETVGALFPASALPENPAEHGAILPRLKEWGEEIEQLRDNLLQSYREGKNAGLKKIRLAAVRLLSRYPVHPDRLHEWHEVAIRFAEKQNSSTVPGEAARIEMEKIACCASDYANLLQRLDSLTEKLDRARQKILTSHLRMVISIVRTMHCISVPQNDLIQEGNLGLMRAMARFDYRMGHKFSTYATWWVRQAVSKAIANQSRVIRLPAHMLSTISKINAAEQNFLQVHGRMPEIEELAAILELPAVRINAIKKMICQPISIQAPLSEEGALLENLLSDERTSDPERLYAFKLLRIRLGKAIRMLSEREQQILELRYGLNGEETKTLVEISEMFHLSRERIRQIEQRAMEKLRSPALAGGLRDYF